MKTLQRFWIVFPILLGLNSTLAGQGMVEYGLGAGRAATTTAPMKGVTNAIGGVVGSLDKTLKSGQEAPATISPAKGKAARPAAGSQRATLAPAGLTSSAVPVPEPVYEDPMGIRIGISYDEMTHRFGPPALEVTGASDVRMLTYHGKKGIVELDVKDGKVSRVSAMNPEQAAVVLPAGQDPRR
ncbi:MAG TPA: hypothetical protein VMH81_38580 [Bryobacteraceae bacterium]|nr:hypothetical protein [Bryobacteraceae bacterium]